MKLTAKEQAWLIRFEKTMAAAPKSLDKKISSYTIGDSNITLYDKVKFETYIDNNPLGHTDTTDHCNLVRYSESEISDMAFPFTVESTSG